MTRTKEQLDRDITRQAKTCNHCGELKPFSAFWIRREVRDGRQTHCIMCQKSVSFTPEKSRERYLQKAYGISTAEYDELLVRQGGVCAICGAASDSRGRRLVVDHDHATGRVRSLLCGDCNYALGCFKDDANLIRLAAEYLEK